MQGSLKAHQDRMYDGIVADLPLCNSSSAINFENLMLNFSQIGTMVYSASAILEKKNKEVMKVYINLLPEKRYFHRQILIFLGIGFK